MAATFAAMVLLYALFSKFVPIISIWEMKAGELPARRRGHGPGSAAPIPAACKIAPEAARMSAIYGLYADPHVAQQAVDNLRAAGVADARHHGDLVRAVRALRVRSSRREDRDAVDRGRRRAVRPGARRTTCSAPRRCRGRS